MHMVILNDAWLYWNYCKVNMIYMHCSCMSQMNLIASITEENKRRNMKRTVLTTMYIESVCLALAYLSMQRAAKNLGCFGDDEHP